MVLFLLMTSERKKETRSGNGQAVLLRGFLLFNGDNIPVTGPCCCPYLFQLEESFLFLLLQFQRDEEIIHLMKWCIIVNYDCLVCTIELKKGRNERK